MWYPFFIIGGFWFWALLVLSFIVLVLCVEFEAPFKALGTIVVVTACLTLFGNFEPFEWIATHPLHVAGSIVGYFVLGAGWSLVKWWLFVGKRKEVYDDLKFNWLKSQGIKATLVPEELRKDWVKRVRDEFGWGSNKNYQIPQAREFKGRIMTWMAYWPWSVFWSIFDDIIRKIFSAIYAELASTFQRISSRLYGDVANDFVGTDLEGEYK